MSREDTNSTSRIFLPGEKPEVRQKRDAKIYRDRCRDYTNCFDKFVDRTDALRDEIRSLDTKLSEFLIKFVRTDSDIALVRNEHANLQKEVSHIRKLVHGAAGLILTMVLTSIMYLVLRRAD